MQAYITTLNIITFLNFSIVQAYSSEQRFTRWTLPYTRVHGNTMLHCLRMRKNIHEMVTSTYRVLTSLRRSLFVIVVEISTNPLNAEIMDF